MQETDKKSSTASNQPFQAGCALEGRQVSPAERAKQR